MALFQKSFKGKKIKLNGKTGVGKERDLFFHGKKNGRNQIYKTFLPRKVNKCLTNVAKNYFLNEKYSPAFLLVSIFGIFKNNITFFTTNQCENVHTVNSAGIQTHNL